MGVFVAHPGPELRTVGTCFWATTSFHKTKLGDHVGLRFRSQGSNLKGCDFRCCCLFEQLCCVWSAAEGFTNP